MRNILKSFRFFFFDKPNEICKLHFLTDFHAYLYDVCNNVFNPIWFFVFKKKNKKTMGIWPTDLTF